MPNKDRSDHESPEKHGSEGWLYSEEQQLLTQFRSDAATLHAKWVELRTFTWIPPQNPVPQNTRRMLHPNRPRSLGSHAEDRLGAVQTTGAVRTNANRPHGSSALKPTHSHQ